MAELGTDFQFEVDGVVFGTNVGAGMWVEPDGFTPGAPDIRDQDVDNDDDDGTRPGRDRYGRSTWGWTLYSNAIDAASALAAAAQLRAVWPREEIRNTPGAVTALRYRIGGRTRRVYGRPRRWTPVPKTVVRSGKVDVVADFVVMDPRFYDDTEHSRQLTLSEVPVPTSGVVVPFTAPFTSLATSTSPGKVITVGGVLPTPVVLEFGGPNGVDTPRLEVPSAGWVAQVDQLIQPGDTVTLDARPWARSAVVASSGAAAQISPRVTRLAELLLPPGQHTLHFSGFDPSGTGRVTVRWYEAYPSL